MKDKTKKFIFIIVVFVIMAIMAGVYGGAISVFNHYLRNNGMLTPIANLALIFALGFGLYKIYKWFCRRLDSVNK